MEKILITDFVKEYNAAQSETGKTKQIKNIIKRHYCPVTEKRLILDLMLQKSVVEDGVKFIDMFINRINFYGAIIALYTTIIPEKDDDGNSKTFEMYDSLIENDILTLILAEIGKNEIEELTQINGVLLNNWYSKNNSTEAYINSFISTASQKFGIAAGMGMESLSKVLNDEKKMKNIATLLDKILKKI